MRSATLNMECINSNLAELGMKEAEGWKEEERNVKETKNSRKVKYTCTHTHKLVKSNV